MPDWKEMCGKTAVARKKLYKNKAVKAKRAAMCETGKHPRCDGKGSYKCVKNPTRKKTGMARRDSKGRFLALK